MGITTTYTRQFDSQISKLRVCYSFQIDFSINNFPT